MGAADSEDLWSVVEKPATETERAKNFKALFILRAGLDPIELGKTGCCTSANELWVKLQENYEGTKSTVTGTVSSEWSTIRMKPDEDLMTFCGRFEQLLSKLESINYKVPPDQKLHFLIKFLDRDSR